MEHTENYKQNSALSQSDLKLFENNIVQFYEQKFNGAIPDKKATKSIDLGNVVDVLLTDKDSFTEKYHVYDSNKISDSLRQIANRVMYDLSVKVEKKTLTQEQILMNPIIMYSAEFLQIARTITLDSPEGPKTGYKANYKDETLTAELMDKCQRYWEELKLSYGKIMLNAVDFNEAHFMANRIQTDPIINQLMAPVWNPEAYPDIEIVKQLVLYGTLNERTRIKGILDLVIINHKVKEIFFTDIKTSSDPGQFMDSYIKFKYFRQGPFYKTLLEQNYPGYTVHHPYFTVGFSNPDYYPELYQISGRDVMVAMTGGNMRGGRLIKGILPLVEEIEWHKEHNLWEHRQSYYLQNQNNLSLFI